MADVVDMASEIEGEHLARGIAAARAPIAVGAPGVCDDCGDEMPRLVGGRCAPCRDGRNRLAARREAAGDGTAEPAPVPRRQWIGTAPAAPEQQEVTVAGERKRAVTMTATGPVLAAIEAGQDAHGGLGASALALIEAGLAAKTGAGASETAPGPIDLGAVHLDALLDEVRARFGRAVADGEASAALQAQARAAEERAEAAERAHAALRGKVEALLG